MPPKKKPTTEQVLLAQAPHQIAVLNKGVIQDVIGVPERFAALLLDPDTTFEYFNGATLPQDSEGRNVIAMTRLDEETLEWVHIEQDGSERREPLGISPWDVTEDE
jgi:hypothetical protein